MDTNFNYELLTADYARQLTQNAQKELAEQEYIYIKEQILNATKCGKSSVVFRKKIFNNNKKQLIKNGFKVTTEQEQCSITTYNYGSNVENYSWITTIEW